MHCTIFNHRDPSLLQLSVLGEKRKYDHRFGGEPNVKIEKGKRPIQLLFSLDLADSRIGMKAAGINRLPLLNAFRFDGGFEYEVLSNDRAKILQQGKKASKDFPYEDYPDSFPEYAATFRKQAFDVHDFESLMFCGGVFGRQLLGQLSEKEKKKLDKKLHEELELFGQDDEGLPLDDLFEQHGCNMFLFPQGIPRSQCPNTACPGARKGIPKCQMKVVAIIVAEAEDEQDLGFSLWGESGDAEEVRLYFERRDRCHSISVSNQCT